MPVEDIDAVPMRAYPPPGKQPQFREKMVLATFENKINLLNQTKMLKTFEYTELRHQRQINKLKAWKKSYQGTKDTWVPAPCSTLKS